MGKEHFYEYHIPSFNALANGLQINVFNEAY